MESEKSHFETFRPSMVQPDERYKESYIEALKEYREVDGEQIDIEDRERNFDQFLAKLENEKTGSENGKVPSYQYWFVEGSRYIGRLNYRPTLNDTLRFKGGNVGYSVRPSERGKGYATTFLKEAIAFAKADGLSELLLTCNSDNIASIKVIENCGGKFSSDAVDETGIKFNRYIIKL
jgi:predicted acetyltransferase